MFITHYTGIEAVKEVDKILNFDNANKQFMEYINTHPNVTIDESQYKISSYIQHKKGNDIFMNKNVQRFSASVIQNSDNNMLTTFKTLWFPYTMQAKPMLEIVDNVDEKSSVEDAVDSKLVNRYKKINLDSDSDESVDEEEEIEIKVEPEEDKIYGISGTVADIYSKPKELADFIKIYEETKDEFGQFLKEYKETEDSVKKDDSKAKYLQWKNRLVELFIIYHVSNKREDYLQEANFFHQYFFENLCDMEENQLELPNKSVSGLTFMSQIVLDFLYNLENITLVNSNFDVFLLIHHAVMSASDSYDKEVQNNVLATGKEAGGKSFLIYIQKLLTVGGIYWERADITEGVLTTGSSLNDRVFVQNEASMKLLIPGGKNVNENLVNLMKTIFTEKVLSKERLKDFMTQIVRREMGLTYIGATNKNASYIEGPTKSRICTIQCPAVSRPNRSVKALNTLFKKKKDSVEFKKFCLNQQKLQNLVYFVNKFIQCKIIEDVDFTVFDYLCKKFDDELKVFNLNDLFTTRIKTQIRRVCKTLVIERALYFALQSNKYNLYDLLNVEQFLYSTTDVTLMAISIYVNKFYDSFKNMFFLHVLVKHNLVIKQVNDDEVVNRINPDAKELNGYYVIENIVDTSSYNSDKLGLHKFVSEQCKTFSGRTYADTDVFDAIKSLTKEEYKGQKVLKQYDHFGVWHINKSYLDDLVKNGDFMISVFNKVGKICGGGIIRSDKFPLLIFKDICKPYSPIFMNVDEPAGGIHLDNDIKGHTHFHDLDSAGYFSLKSKVLHAVSPFNFPSFFESNLVTYKDRYALKLFKSKRGRTYTDPLENKKRKLQKIEF